MTANNKTAVTDRLPAVARLYYTGDPTRRYRRASTRNGPGEPLCFVSVAQSRIDVLTSRIAELEQAATAAQPAQAVGNNPAAFENWYARENETANNHMEGDDWLELDPGERDNYRAAFDAGVAHFRRVIAPIPADDAKVLYPTQDAMAIDLLVAAGHCSASQVAQARTIAAHHSADDDAVDSFAQAMKDKMARSRAKGRGGWQACSPDDLSRMLRDHVEKGDYHLGKPIAARPAPAVDTVPVHAASPTLRDDEKARIVDGFLSIRIPVETLVFAAQNSDYFFDAAENGEALVITDQSNFAKSVAHALNVEADDGSTPVTRMLDKAFIWVVEQGEEGVDAARADTGDKT